jgi:phosphoglycerate kinase
MLNFDQSNFSGKRVIMRVDFNVPLNQAFEITDDTRIKGAIESVRKIWTMVAVLYS